LIALTPPAQDLCLFHQTCELPDHAPYFSKRLGQYNELFRDGDFGPTNERGAASAYRDPDATDFVAPKGVDSGDVLTNFWSYNVDWVEEHVLRRVRGLFKTGQRPQQGLQRTHVEFSTIVKTIDAFTCVFIPLLLTATLYALVLVGPLKVRIAVVGALGVVYSVSAKIVSGRLSRGEMFAYTCAFFAVASVFVSTTNGSISGVS
jgi:hypothetical protein